MQYQTRIHGRIVPPGDYETLRQLERIAFGLTPSEWNDRTAHARALDVAIIMLRVARLEMAKGGK